ncbi:MAG: hypothetical protein NDF54_03385 [archaeon GB-1867-035]|nr:hypothetical protein [Candidatus Culexmicrobium profundum]
MECRNGWPPGETVMEVQSEIEKTIAEAAERDSWFREHPPIIEWFGWKAEPSEQK